MEDRTQRGWHPLVAERLGVWRFSGFELTRLPAPPDVHLFRIRGREVPDDQRLVVLADVRELTIVRDDAGRITGLPQLERILDACLDSLRSARSYQTRCGMWWTPGPPPVAIADRHTGVSDGKTETAVP